MPLLQVSLLRLRDFRALGVASSFDWMAAVAEQVALGWLTLELTDSPLMVGVALGLRMAPLLVVGIPAGVLADRGDRVRLLRITAALLAVASAAPRGLAVAGGVPASLPGWRAVGPGRPSRGPARATSTIWSGAMGWSARWPSSASCCGWEAWSARSWVAPSPPASAPVRPTWRQPPRTSPAPPPCC